MFMATVVGAGPSGISAAKRIRERGWETALIEEHPKVGDPVACTGLISVSGVSDLGIKKEVDEVLMNQIKGAQIFSPSHEMVEVKRSETVAYVVDRGAFDRTLAKSAVELGVDLKLNTRLIDIRNETLFVEHKGRGELIKSRVVVGADGVNSRTRKIAGIETTAKDYVHAYQMDVSGRFDPRYVQLYFGDYSKGFFAWVVPENEERARVGLASTSGNIRKDFNMFIQEKNINGEFCDMCSSLIPVGEPFKEIVKGNVLLTGDAAFQTKATSIDYEEPIVLLDEDGHIRNEKIGELAAAELTNPKNEIICSNENEFAIPERDIMAFSPTQKAENNGFRRVKTVLRHEIDEELYEIILEKGYRVKATANHSVMVATKDGFEAKHTDKLEIGKDIIALNAKIPQGRIIVEINLIKEFMKSCPEQITKKIIVLGARDKLYKNYMEVEKGKASQYWYKNKIPLHRFLGRGIIPGDSRIAVSGSKLSYPDKIVITPELCRLLGYFMAEGSYKSNNLTLTFGNADIERGYVKDAMECIRTALGVEPEKPIVKRHPHTKEPSGLSITFGGTVARNLFLNVLKCGHKTFGKQVPWIMFNVKEELKKEFLKGYLRGDGTMRIRMPEDRKHHSIEISAKTVSRKLASDLVLLSLQLGLFPSIEEFEARDDYSILGNKVKCRSGYRIVYSRIEDMLPLKDVFHEMESNILEFVAGRNGRSTNNIPKDLLTGTERKFSKELAEEFGPSIYSAYSNLSSQRLATVLQGTEERQFVKNVISQGLILLKIREIRKVEPTGKFVYDVEIPETQMFCGGIGPILLHNTGGGIMLGMMAGRVAGDSVDAYFKNNVPLKNYERNLEPINKDLRLHWKVRQFMNSLSNEQMDGLFRKMRKAKVGEFLAEAGDMDRPTRFIGKILAKPSMWRLFPEAVKFFTT